MGTAASTVARRAWRPALSPPPPGAGPPLTVVTYNILADKYATSGAHSYCPPALLAWPRRKAALLAELLGLGADILCLQEVERPFFEGELQPLMAQHGYQALYYARRRRPNEPPSLPEEGISLLWRSERLEPRATKAVRLANLVDPRLHGKFWQAVRSKEDGALFALLRDKATSRHLLAGCTHLFWDPRYPDIKAAQAHLLCQAATRFLREQPALQNLTPEQAASAMPTVLCGDFNSLPHKRHSDPFDEVPPGHTLVSGAYTLLSSTAGSSSQSGWIDASHPDHPIRRSLAAAGDRELAQLRLTSHPLQLSSAAVLAWGREPPVTNKTAGFAGCLDYAWLSRGHWAVGQALEMPYRFDPAPPGRPFFVEDPQQVSDLPACPSERFPSDHLPLGFKLHMMPAGRGAG